MTRKRKRQIANIINFIKDMIIAVLVFYGIATLFSSLYWLVFVYFGW